MSNKKLWYFCESIFSYGTFAQAWLRSPPQTVVPSLCKRCGRGARHVWPKPLVIEWEPGLDNIGDFTWPDVRPVVKRTVFDVLAARFRGIHAEPIEMVQDPKLKRPKRPTKRTKPRVWLPYTGPELVELWPDHLVPFLPETSFEAPYKCKDCGYEPLQLSGIELKAHRYNLDIKDLVPDIRPRVPGKGVFVAASEIGDKPIFRLKEFTGPVLCTDEVKSFVEEQGFTNVDFAEYGDIVG